MTMVTLLRDCCDIAYGVPYAIAYRMESLKQSTMECLDIANGVPIGVPKECLH